MSYLLLLLGLLLCAAQAIRAPRLLLSTLWLAGASALLAVFLYIVGALELAAIELSVGLALVTVLLVFAIAITGEAEPAARALVPRPLALGLVALAVALLGWLAWPRQGAGAPAQAETFAEVLWGQRGMDVLVQVAIIFAGAIGVLSLLAEADAPPQGEQSAKTPRMPRSSAARSLFLIHQGHEGDAGDEFVAPRIDSKLPDIRALGGFRKPARHSRVRARDQYVVGEAAREEVDV